MRLEVRQGLKNESQSPPGVQTLSHSQIPLEEDWDIDLLVRLCSRFLTDFCYETGVFNPGGSVNLRQIYGRAIALVLLRDL